MMHYIEIIVDGNLYSEIVLYKCLYWYTGRYTVDVQPSSTGYLVRFEQAEAFSDESSLALLSKFQKDLIDFKLRQIVNEETRAVRELIIAKAFAHFDSTETPSSVSTDPVGFDPKTVRA